MNTIRIVLFLLAGALSIGAQTPAKSKLVGVIYDAAGAVIARARVTAVGGGKTYTAISNDAGKYELALPVIADAFNMAKYDITVDTASGFKKAEIRGYIFAPSYKGEMNLDFALEVAENINTIIIPPEKAA